MGIEALAKARLRIIQNEASENDEQEVAPELEEAS